MGTWRGSWPFISKDPLLFFLMFSASFLLLDCTEPWDIVLPWDPTIRKGVLSNGLRYVLLPTRHECQLLTRLSICAGSIDEVSATCSKRSR